MKTLEWKFEDHRKRWSSETKDRSGPWDSEPDKRQWMSEAGLPCLIVRNFFGALCGYVGVPKSHPWYGQEYEDIEAQMVKDALTEDVEIPHGGLTFAHRCNERNPEHGICHLVEPGEDDDVWWLGFDCAHAFDLVPGLHRFTDDSEIYRDFAYTTAECEKLATLLRAKHGMHGS